MIHKRVTLATITGLTAALALTACGGANGDTTLNTSSGQAVTQDLSQADPQAADDGGDAQGGDAQGGDAQGDDAQGGGVAAAGGGYGSADGSSSDGYGSSGGDSSATALAGTVTTLLRAKKTKTMGWILVNQNGKTLYRFDQDEDDPPTSTCKGACNVKWPLALAGSSGPARHRATVQRPEGPHLEGLDAVRVLRRQGGGRLERPRSPGRLVGHPAERQEGHEVHAAREFRQQRLGGRRFG